jgi:hypothetical protein
MAGRGIEVQPAMMEATERSSAALSTMPISTSGRCAGVALYLDVQVLHAVSMEGGWSVIALPIPELGFPEERLCAGLQPCKVRA